MEVQFLAQALVARERDYRGHNNRLNVNRDCKFHCQLHAHVHVHVHAQGCLVQVESFLL